MSDCGGCPGRCGKVCGCGFTFGVLIGAALGLLAHLSYWMV